jgi:hypothetical protein
MKIRLNKHRHCFASVWAALFVVAIVAIFIGLLVSFLVRCTKLPSREFPSQEETNSFSVNFAWNSAVPLVAQRQPDPEQPARTTNTFQSSVQFLWDDCMSNGVLVILRSLDWQEWTMLYNVMFGEQSFSNVVMVNASGQLSTNLTTAVEFLDQDAPSAKSFYKGLVITNR